MKFAGRRRCRLVGEGLFHGTDEVCRAQTMPLAMFLRYVLKSPKECFHIRNEGGILSIKVRG
jgi:hypothetical protein